MMLEPRAILSQVRKGEFPLAERSSQRGAGGGFLRGTSGDPDPILVIKPEGVVEFVDTEKAYSSWTSISWPKPRYE
jgi:uncharacterized spore protein YtfJ